MNPYVIGGGVAIVAIMGVLLKNAYERTGELEAELKDQVTETEECVSANGTNQDTITLLEEQLADMVRQRRSEAAERERVLTERERELEAARARADRLEREREDEITNNDDCAAIMQRDISLACPATAHQLRQRSIGESGDGDPDG